MFFVRQNTVSKVGNSSALLVHVHVPIVMFQTEKVTCQRMKTRRRKSAVFSILIDDSSCPQVMWMYISSTSLVDSAYSV